MGMIEKNLGLRQKENNLFDLKLTFNVKECRLKIFNEKGNLLINNKET